MAAMTLEHKEMTWLDTHASEWVGAGLISEGQADAIRHYEHLDEPVPERRLPLVTEIATYLAGVVAFAGGAAIVGPNWERIGLFGQLLIGLAVAALGFVVGTWVVRLGESGTERVGWFLWLVGTGGLALSAGAVMNRIDPADQGWYRFMIGLSVLVPGALLWRNLDRPVQLLTVGLGVGLTGGGLAELTDASPWAAAPITWACAAALGVLAAAGYVRPRLVALMLAGAGLMAGSFAFFAGNEKFGATIALATAAGIVIFALRERSMPLVVMAMFAFFVATTSMMQTVLQGMLSRLVAVVIGLAVLAFVAVRAQRMNARPGGGGG